MNTVEVGAIERLVDVFVQDATVSTGAGLPNLVVSTFSSYYHRSDMTSTSSVTLVSTGTLGTWSSGQFLQVNSTFMRGWYQFACPNGMFATGSTVALHMYGHPSMAPVVKAIDITRFNLQSATVDANRVGVSSFGLQVGVSTFDSRVGVSSFDLPVGVSTFNSPVGVSSFGIAVGVSSISVGVSTSWLSGGTIVTSAAGVLSVNVSSIQGDSAVTTAAGVFAVGAVGVSSFDIRVGVSSFNSPVGVSSFGIAVGVSSLSVGVSTSWFSGGTVVTSAAGVLASHVTSMRAVVDAQIADRLLARNIAGGSDTGRIVNEALYFLRNRSEIGGGVLTVYQTDDTTSSWAANVTTTAGNPISQIDPT